MGQARILQAKLAPPPLPPPRFPPSRPQITPHSVTAATPPQPGRLPFRYLTPAEITARHEKGLCFNCDAQFVKGHRCSPAKFQCKIIDDQLNLTYDEHSALATMELIPSAPPTDDEPTPVEISLKAMEGFTDPATLRFKGTIQG